MAGVVGRCERRGGFSGPAIEAAVCLRSRSHLANTYQDVIRI